jgi:2',3'-cyclic-nucleotide 2'-phosphodiesterase (5'-nucleotidase family)
LFFSSLLSDLSLLQSLRRIHREIQAVNPSKSFTMHLQSISLVLLSAAATLACDSCYGPTNYDIHTRHVRRQQPDALNATTGPRAPLEWGQLNFLHTTDTHGWMAGHLKERNYGADWGDFVSFIRRMKQKAGNMGVDLLLVDTGKNLDDQRDST